MNSVRFLLQVLCIGCLMCSCKNAKNTPGSNGMNSSTTDASISEAGKKYQYRLHPEVGKKYLYTIKTATNTKLEVNDKTIETGNRSEIGIVYEIVKDTSNNLLIKLTYNKIYIVLQKTDMEDEIIDADKDAAQRTTVEQLLSTIKGSSILLTINAAGDIISSTGSKEITDKIIGGLSDGDVKMKQLVQQLLSKFTGEGFIQDNLKEGFKLFPDSAVNVGDTWNKKTSQSADISFESLTKYALTSLEDNIAYIETVGQISSGKNTTSNIMGQQVTTNLNGEQTGNFKTDISTGMLQSGKTDISIKGTIQVSGREVPVTLKIKKEIVLSQ